MLPDDPPTTMNEEELAAEVAAVIGRLDELVRQDGRDFAEIATLAGMSRQQFYQTFNRSGPKLALATVCRILKALGHDWDALKRPPVHRDGPENLPNL